MALLDIPWLNPLDYLARDRVDGTGEGTMGSERAEYAIAGTYREYLAWRSEDPKGRARVTFLNTAERAEQFAASARKGTVHRVGVVGAVAGEGCGGEAGGRGVKRAALALLVALTACGESGTGPQTQDPGPTNVALVTVEVLGNGDTRTTLENRGGPGSYRLEFIGTRLNEPATTCAPSLIGTTDPVQVDAGYREELTWATRIDPYASSGPGTVKLVVAYSRSLNTAIWTETDRWSAC
jgi:hypothetical protein